MVKGNSIEKIVDHILSESIDKQVVLSPLVWKPGKRGSKVWYFTSSTSGKDGRRVDVITTQADNQETGEIERYRIVAELTNRPPLVVHDCGDELYAAQLCETLWPGERIKAAREAIEAERRAA